MNKLSLSGVIVWLSLLFFVTLGTSCINEEYDLSKDNFNLEITPFQEGLILPVGRTEQITLGKLLDGVDTGGILDFSNGGLGVICYKSPEPIDLTEQLSELTDLVKIEDVDYSQPVSFSLENVDVSKVKIEEQSFSSDPYNLSEEIEVPEIEIPDLSENKVEERINANLGDYVPTEKQLTIDLKSINMEHTFISLAGDIPFDLLGIPGDYELKLADLPPALEGYIHPVEDVDLTQTIPLAVELPKGIKNVNEVIFDENAQVVISLKLKNPFLKSGSITPDIVVDLSHVFNLERNPDGTEKFPGNKVNLNPELVMSHNDNPELNYFADMVIGIESLVEVPEGQWTKTEDGMLLNMEIDIPANGRILYSDDLITTPDMLNNSDGLEILLDVDFVDIKIADVEIEIDPVEFPYNQDIPLQMTFDIPDGVGSISGIKFTDNNPDSGIDLSLMAENLEDVHGLNTKLDLVVLFPQELIVEGVTETETVDGKVYKRLPITCDDLAAGVDRLVRITGLNLPDPVPHPTDETKQQIVINEMIMVKALAVADGIVSSADLQALKDAGKDVVFHVNAIPDLKLADYNVEIDGFDYEVVYPGPDDDPSKSEINEPLDGFPEINEVTIYPEGNPVITVDLTIPEIPGLKIAPDGDFVFSFPPMLRFKNTDRLPASCRYVFEDNADPELAKNLLIIKNGEEIPSEINLEVDKLVVRPELNDEDGMYYIRGKVSAKGKVAITGNLTKEVVDGFETAGYVVAMEAYIPELVPSSLNLDMFEKSIHEKVELDILSEDKVPEELVGVGRIELNKTYIDIDLDASTLPALGEGAELNIAIDVKLPPMVEIVAPENSENLQYKDGKLSVNGKLDENGHVVIPRITVEALNLTDVDITKGIKDSIVVDGSIQLVNPSLDVDSWLKTHTVDLSAKLLSEELVDYIDISKIEAKVDVAVGKTEEDKIEESVDLTSITKMIEESGVSATLSFNHAHLYLEIVTNLEVPVTADLELIPYRGGNPSESLPAKVSINRSLAQTDTLRYWLANGTTKEEARCPENCNFIPLDIVGLLKDIPDSLTFKLTAETSKNEYCVLRPGTEYELKADYRFDLPLEFGEGMEVSYCDTLPFIPQKLAGLVLDKGNKIKLMGEIKNSLPLNLLLNFDILDADNNLVESAEGCGVQLIKAGGANGEATPTPLEAMIGLKEGQDLSNLKYLRLHFTANTDKDYIGVPVTEGSFLQADLKVALPEGFTVDLGELLEDSDNENPEDYE